MADQPMGDEPQNDNDPITDETLRAWNLLAYLVSHQPPDLDADKALNQKLKLAECATTAMPLLISAYQLHKSLLAAAYERNLSLQERADGNTTTNN